MVQQMTTLFADYQVWLANEPLTPGQKKALQTAIELFAKQGYQETSTAQIAKVAGISEATIFKYYHTKEELLLAVITPLITHLLPKVQRDFFRQVQAQGSLDLASLIHFIVADRFAFMQANQPLVRIILQESLLNSAVKTLVITGIEQATAANADLMTRFRAQVLARHPEYDALVMVRSIMGPLVAYFLQRFVLAPTAPFDEARDLALIEKQIISVLS